MKTWVGKAFCILSECNEAYDEGFRGAYIVVVCRADEIEAAISMIKSELLESSLILSGFDYFFEENVMDRSVSDYESELIGRLSQYPVQFENVHFFKPDS